MHHVVYSHKIARVQAKLRKLLVILAKEEGGREGGAFYDNSSLPFPHACTITCLLDVSPPVCRHVCRVSYSKLSSHSHWQLHVVLEAP